MFGFYMIKKCSSPHFVTFDQVFRSMKLVGDMGKLDIIDNHAGGSFGQNDGDQDQHPPLFLKRTNARILKAPISSK